MKHVFGKKNKVAILLRKKEAGFYRKITSQRKKKSFGNTTKTIVCYPEFKSSEDFFITINKFAWAFPQAYDIDILYSINEKAARDLDATDATTYLKNQGLYYHNNTNIKRVGSQQLRENFKEASLIAIHKKNERYSIQLWPYLDKCKVIDPLYYSLEEGNFWKFGLYDLLNDEEKLLYKNISASNYKSFRNKHLNKTKANIFVTGPSYNSYKDFEYGEDSIKIVCNTIVKDNEFLEFINGPDIITFADPVFHFSSCLYAHEFRELVLAAVAKYDSYIAVPASTVPLMLGNYPQLKDRIIGLSRSESLVFPSEKNLSVKPSGSIITFMMLPLASSLAKTVYILGADGRAPQENYFWKHNEKVQLKELMESVFLTHPSFFRDRDYLDHYKAHCDYVEETLIKGEKEGIKYFSLSQSYVPALKDRMAIK
jgi:hypothetical protein